MNRQQLVLCGLIVGVARGVCSAEPPRAAVPAEGPIVIRDYGYRDWAPALLHYRFPAGAKLKTGPVALSDAAGRAIPAQVEGGELLFVAGLAKGGTATFTLGNGPQAASPLQVDRSRRQVEVRNEFFALRLPPEGREEFKTPRAAAEVPGPLSAWQVVGGPWIGATRFVCARPVRSMTVTTLKNGPAVFEQEARYTFEPAGEYVCRVRVCPGIDHAEIAEEYDFGAHTEGQDFLLVELQKGFEPVTVGLTRGDGETGQAADRKPYKDYLDAKLKANANPAAPVGGAGPTPLPPVPEPGMVLLEKVLPGGKWGGCAGAFELRAVAADTNTLPVARVAATPLHVGNWRRALAMTVWHKPGAGAVLALPISTRHGRWYAEVADDISPFSTHEHDISLPPSYGRREWALAFGAEPARLQQTAGYIGLDRYKDWILEWPETVKASEYPRAWFTKADVELLKKSLDRHPDREALAQYYVFSGKVEDAARHAKEFSNGILGQHGYLGNWYVSGLSHYRQSQSLMPAAHLADDALACPELPADLRQEVRRTLALSAYMMADPDLNPRGVGVHLGNNNMSINRTCALSYFAGELPDHPLYRMWMGQAAAHAAYKLATQVAQDGATIECPTYWLYGPLRFLEPALTIIRNTGGPDLAKWQARSLRYFANLTVADPRFNGRRIIPGMGNSANIQESIFGSALATVLRGEPDLAPLAQRLHRAAWPTEPLGSTLYNCRWFAFQYRPEVPEGGSLATCVMPTYGVVFRNRFGAADESTLLFRTGINWSHWDTDAGNLILYGHGAPLSPGTGYQYYYGAASENESVYHNQVKVGARNQQEVFGRVDDALLDYGLGATADYAVNSRLYPSQLFPDGKGAMSWNRHVLFLKGASDYAVVRDTFPGGTGRSTWWTWLNLGSGDVVRVDGKAFDAAAVPFDKVVPPDSVPALTGRVLELGTPFGAQTWMWFASAEPLPFRARLTFTADNMGLLGLKRENYPLQAPKEVKTIVEAEAPAGGDYFYAMVPRKDGAPAPACERVGEHALKIQGADSTDYAFVSDEPMAFEKDGVVFSGKAGAVRVGADQVTFCLNAGTGRVGYQGTVFEGPGPFERTVKLADLKPGVTPVGDTYEKKRLAVDIGGGITVEGEGPFEAKLDGKKIVLAVDGRARVFYVTRPDWIERPWMTIDGVPWMACWTDYPASGWGRYDRTALIAFSVPDGKHAVELSDVVFPACWPRQFEPALAGVSLRGTGF